MVAARAGSIVLLSTNQKRKLLFYQRYGVEEYYLYDPDSHNFQGWLRQEGLLSSIPEIKGWVSPRLNIRFDLREDGLEIYSLDGQKFLSSIELSQRLEQERLKAEQARLQLEQERLKAERLAEYIRSLGIDEIALVKGQKNYCAVLVNLDTGKLIAILEKRTQELRTN